MNRAEGLRGFRVPKPSSIIRVPLSGVECLGSRQMVEAFQPPTPKAGCDGICIKGGWLNAFHKVLLLCDVPLAGGS